MWRKPTDAVPSSQPSNAPNTVPSRPRDEAQDPAARPSYSPVSAATLGQNSGQTDSSRGSRIGPGLKISGEISGSSDLFLDGEASGKICVTDARVTVGPNGRVQADIEAREIVVNGNVEGSLKAGERLRLGNSSIVKGSLVAPSIGIDDGATFRGKVEVMRKSPGMHSGAPEPASDVEMLRPVGAHTEGE